MSEIFLYPNLGVDRSIEISGKKALKFLAWFKKSLDPFLTSYFAEKIKEASQIHPETIVLVEEIRRFVQNGGKRIRPALAYAAYLAAGGRSHEAILYASSALEIFHGFALIHDDIIDKATLRRGKPAVHKVFEDFHKKRGFTGSAQEFGNSAAILTGDLAMAFSDELLNTSPFPSERIRRAKSQFDLMKKQVILGEYLDIVAPLKKEISEEDVLKIAEYKTAKYTIERPAHIGALLAGADEEILQALSNYAVPFGQAFQIQDDIVGTFSSQETIGKPVDSDIKEGKKTILIVKAYEFSSSKGSDLLNRTLGNSNASKAEIEGVKNLIRESGALDYSLQLSRSLIEQAKESLYSVKLADEGKNYFLTAADYLLTRQL